MNKIGILVQGSGQVKTRVTGKKEASKLASEHYLFNILASRLAN